MNRQFLCYCLFLIFSLSACGGDNGQQTPSQDTPQPETLTDVQKIARDLCGCLDAMDWKSIEASGQQNNQAAMQGMGKFFTCSMALRSKYDVDVMNGKEVVAEMGRICPVLQQKMDRLKNRMK